MFSRLCDLLANQEILLVAIIMAMIVWRFPLQHYGSLTRTQHCGLSLFVLGLGNILQAIWSWRALRFWTRVLLSATGLYICAIALICYSNPWLDPIADLRTSLQTSWRPALIASCALPALPLLYIWYRALGESRDKRKQ